MAYMGGKVVLAYEEGGTWGVLLLGAREGIT